MRIGFLRHGPTLWNQHKRLQGRTNIPLSKSAQAWFAGRRLPDAFQPARCLASPLSRAIETARLLSPVDVEIEPRLIETNWGQWEGQTLDDLRAADPAGMAKEEGRGIDLSPPGGESPRQVCQRLSGLCRALAGNSGPGPMLAVTHKGVIRAALSLATGWDYLGKPPVKLDWQCLHIFEIGPAGEVHLVEPNLLLERRR